MNLSPLNTGSMKSNTGVSMKDVGILVLGHGSSLPYNKELVESLAQMIGKNHSGPVRTAYLNMNQPDIPEGLKSFAGTNVKKIVALAALLGPRGSHPPGYPPGDGRGSAKAQRHFEDMGRRGGGHLCRAPGRGRMHCDTGMQAGGRSSKVAVLDTIHGGAAIARKMVESGLEAEAFEVYHHTPSLAGFDLVVAPVHLAPNNPATSQARDGK